MLNSPGGEVYSSEAIYQAFKDLAKIKPVYVYIESEDASGAYYISLGATKIYASPVSIIGSIGVYMEVFNYDDLLNKIGIKHKYIVSSNAKYKLADKWLFGNSNESKYVQQAVQDVIDQTEKVFWDRVQENRPTIPLKNLQGLIFSAPKAKALNLIDGVDSKPVSIITKMLNNQHFKNNEYVVVEYSLGQLGKYKGISAKIAEIFRILGGGSDYYLMWK